MPCKRISWAPWPAYKFASAVWTCVVEFVFHALGAERALKGTNSRLETVVGEISVATLAAWT